MPTSEVAPLPQKQWREFCAEARKYRDEPVTRLCATLERYHEVLEFYADRENWKVVHPYILEGPVWPTSVAMDGGDNARALLDAEMRPGRRFRLIGVGLANLQTEDEWEGAQGMEAVQLPLIPPV